MTKRLKFFAALSASALLLSACAQDDSDTDDDVSVDDEEPDDEPEQMLGFDDCDDFPDTCNSGERAEGGEITWIVNALPGAWMGFSPEGGSVYTLQGITQGILPYTGQWQPGGEYEHNMDLLAQEPELINDGEGDEPFTYEFYLSEDAEWDDGTPITADDFIVTWQLSTSEEEGHCEGCRSRSPDSYDRIASIEGSDDGKTVTITLKEGEADPEWFGWGSAHNIVGGVVPAHVAEENGFDLDDPAGVGEYFEFLNDNMPEFSGGPYQIVEGDLENQIIKEPNPNWYGEEEPTLDTVIMRFLDDEGAWVSAVENGEVHGSSPATFGEDVIRGLEDLPDVHLHIQPGPSWEHIDLNFDTPAFEDEVLRQAIFTAIDAEEIAQRAYGGAFPDIEQKTNHLFSADSEFHEDVITPTGQGSGDTEAAIEMLEDAGYELDDGTLMLDGEQVGPFRLRSTATPTRETSMELTQAMLGDIGIEVQIEPTDDLGGTLVEADYDIMQFGWSGSPFFVESPVQFWQSESGSNFGGYANDEVDDLVARVLQQSSLEDAAELANEAAAIVAEDAYALPLHETPVYIFVADDYVNIRDNPNSSLRGVYNLGEWGLLAE